jgi:hypothetical protein
MVVMPHAPPRCGRSSANTASFRIACEVEVRWLQGARARIREFVEVPAVLGDGESSLLDELVSEFQRRAMPNA